MKKLLMIALILTSACTNYSTATRTVNPPILISITAEGSGHYLTIAVQNAEVGFEGYRLFQGISDSAVNKASASTGIDCSFPLTTIPILATQYQIDVKPDQTAPSGGRLCNVPLKLTSGTYIALRSLLYKDPTSVNTSLSSNSLLVP